MYQEKIIDLETAIETTRNYTAEEIVAVEKAQAQAAIELEAHAAKEAARKAVLEKLGLTADEATALLG